jgi:hypothetical protein
MPLAAWQSSCRRADLSVISAVSPKNETGRLSEICTPLAASMRLARASRLQAVLARQIA